MGLYKLTEIFNLTGADSQPSGEKISWGDLQGRTGLLENWDHPGDVRDIDNWTKEARMKCNNDQSTSST